MKRCIYSVLLLIVVIQFSPSSLHAQQDPQFSQYMLNQFVYNPAYAGLDNVLSATAHVRSQWVGITGHPITQNISVHSPVMLLHGGMGIDILNEQEGAMRITSASLAYSFIQKSRIGKFSFAVSGGIEQLNLDGTKLRAPDGTYENFSIEHNDPLLPVVNANSLSPDFAAGFFFSNSKIDIGLSTTHIIPMSIKLNGGGASLEMDLVRQYYLQAGYLSRLSKTITFRPSIYVKSNGDNLQGEADLVFTFNNFFWVGGGFRGYNDITKDGMIGMAGFNIGEKLRVGYSYDYTVSALNATSTGSHELVLNYRVNLVKPAKPGKAIYNPRF